jgi:hypothetical protein
VVPRIRRGYLFISRDRNGIEEGAFAGWVAAKEHAGQNCRLPTDPWRKIVCIAATEISWIAYEISRTEEQPGGKTTGTEGYPFDRHLHNPEQDKQPNLKSTLRVAGFVARGQTSLGTGACRRAILREVEHPTPDLQPRTGKRRQRRVRWMHKVAGKPCKQRGFSDPPRADTGAVPGRFRGSTVWP